MTPPRIELRSLSKSFHSGDRLLIVLRDVDLAVEAGESVAILGPSGSGKSTLLALIAGLDGPSSGEVLLDGRAIQNLSEDKLSILRRHTIGFVFQSYELLAVFQSYELLANLTARENVLLPLELVDDPDSLEKANELLAKVGLSERGHHYPTQLSGGEQQRVALARAFAASPPILLADEPTGNLDRATGARVLEVLGQLRQQFDTTLVIVTHDPAVARLADRRFHLEDGCLTEEDGSELGET